VVVPRRYAGLTALLACGALAAGCGTSDGGVEVHVPGTATPASLGPRISRSARSGAEAAAAEANQATAAAAQQVRTACVMQAQALQSGVAQQAPVAACRNVGAR
jgi:hypothetical protein